MPRWFWKLLWFSQVINWVVMIWAYGTVNGSCILAPAFTTAWVLRHEITDTVKVIFTDDWDVEDEEKETKKDCYYYELRKGA